MKYLTLCLWLLVLAKAMPAVAANKTTPLLDYGDRKAPALWQSLRDLEDKKRQEPIRIIQLGDSHTAGDYFSGQLRQRLQNQFGNAGIGWLTPGYITNQRSSQVLLRSTGNWKLSDAKQYKHSGVFPVGGFITTSAGNSILEIKVKEVPAAGLWRLNIWQNSRQTPWSLALTGGKVHKLPGQGDAKAPWRLSTHELDASKVSGLKLLAPSGGKLGGVILDRVAPGITLDALGNNGSVANVINRWDSSTVRSQLQWRNPQLIILAYGTNEAFGKDLMPDTYEAELRQAIRSLRGAAPEAAILLVGAPSSGKSRPPHLNGGCRVPLPPSLIKVQNSQRRIARQEGTLYWDWSAMMGGNCGAQFWLKQKTPFMRPDLVHMSAEGYVASADALYIALLDEMDKALKRMAAAQKN
ncbi:MAG: GDSL-type esterase/lipase family protein [Sideroxyarcus sp.]|nr:GDSL-type esterase/lipase family protein [Sideroxyarcus sp.]